MNEENFFLLFDKPQGITSFDVVARARRAFHIKSIGHSGTLDPAATGLMLLAVGKKATRLLEYFVGLDKTYKAQIRLGITTSTDDIEGEITDHSSPENLTEAQILAAVRNFTGKISQKPSQFSAIKIGGKRAYDLARAGADFEISARTVEISKFEISAITPGALSKLTPEPLNSISKFDSDLSGVVSKLGAKPSGVESKFDSDPSRQAPAEGFPVLDLTAEISCSSGTYIRAIARDLGVDLGCGGHLSMLRRTEIGDFRIENAISEFTSSEKDGKFTGDLNDKILTLKSAISHTLPITEISTEDTAELALGRKIKAPMILSFPDCGNSKVSSEIIAACEGNRLIAICEFIKGYLKPKKVLI